MNQLNAVKDYRVTVSVKNNRILKLIESQGYSNVNQFCNAYKLNSSIVGRIINLKIPPLTMKNGAIVWKGYIVNLANILKVSPDDLFSPEQLEPLKDNKKTVELDFDDMQPLLGVHDNSDPLSLLTDPQHIKTEIVEEMFANLDPRHAKILKLRIGWECEEKTLGEIAEMYGVTRERIRQIEIKALRSIRYLIGTRIHRPGEMQDKVRWVDGLLELNTNR